MQHQWVILKFGGSSVAEPGHWKTIAKAIQAHTQAGNRPILVLSALKNVSNALEAMLHQALAGVHPMAINQLKELHAGFASQLGLDADTILSPWYLALTETCQEIADKGNISPENHAKLLSIGELISTTIGAHYLQSRGIQAHWVDARELLISNNHVDLWHHFTSAQCDFEFDQNLANSLNQYQDVIVTQGFIGADENGKTVLLGREGSDTSAAYLGSKLKANKIEIWTDVPGVFSANPREIPEARQITYLNYHQAKLMAGLGAKVLHPRAVEPAEKYAIPLQVKCTGLPQDKGTSIGQPDSQYQQQVFAVTSEPEITWVSVPAKTGLDSTQSFLKAINAQGFDLVFNHQDSEKRHFIFIYNNSDHPRPADCLLLDKYSRADIKIQSQLSLISILGSSVQFNWSKSVSSLSEAVNKIPLLHQFSIPEQGQLSLLVSNEHNLEMCRRVHERFIESENDKQVFGGSWLDYNA